MSDILVDKYIDYIRSERRRSPCTVKGYAKDLESFEAYFKGLDSQLSWETIDSDIIRDWMESMMDKGNTATSVCRRLSAVRSLYRFALSRQLVNHDPAYSVKGPKKAKRLPHFVREGEMDKLIDQVEWGNTYTDVRARTFILLLYSTGLRRAELVGLDDVNVDFAERQLKVRGKRNKERIIPFGEELNGALRDYVAKRDEEFPFKQTSAFFLSVKGKRIAESVLVREVKRCLSLVSTQKKLSPHVLRHAFATAMLNNGANLEQVKRLLGHESLMTTEIYTHTTFEQLKNAYRSAHPRSGDVKE